MSDDYEIGKLLRQVRAEISKAGVSEHEIAENLSLQGMLDKIQDLRDEMNEAKKAAAQKAAEPYLETIKKLEQQYAMMLKLSS